MVVESCYRIYWFKNLAVVTKIAIIELWKRFPGESFKTSGDLRNWEFVLSMLAVKFEKYSSRTILSMIKFMKIAIFVPKKKRKKKFIFPWKLSFVCPNSSQFN